MLTNSSEYDLLYMVYKKMIFYLNMLSLRMLNRIFQYAYDSNVITFNGCMIIS